MKRKKGFTLIELLAVILILGIIALIAIPTVSKIVSDAKKGAFETTLKNIEKKVNDTCSMQQLKGTAYTTSYTITNGVISPSLDIKGNLPNGTINVGSNCNVTYTLSDNTYTGTKENESGNVEITKNNQTTTDESDDESNSKPTDNITYLNGTYKESLLNGADPKVESDMIPITIANNGTVTKADINSKWYEYGNSVKQWANVVLVTESSRPTYKNANPGTTINQEDILAYLVWIPRYKYAIPSGSGPRAISIVFENKSTPKSTGDATGVNYYTHPAFTFGNDELDGIWVGKFETTVSPSSACVVNHNEEDCKDVDPSILPNISSLRLQQVVHQFATSLKFKSPVYGIKSNSHMMKDSEWGAVAYLSHSIYGIKTDIRINNAYGYITGCGASFDDSDYVTSCQIKYGNASDYPQSTTGNISGIFDMSGGAMERMMANYNNNLNCSGLTSMPDLKYYNLYTVLEYNSSNSKGFATYETQGWYSDSYEVIDTYWDWVYRGGDLWDKETAGLFNTFHSNGGYNNGHDTFRLTISPGA